MFIQNSEQKCCGGGSTTTTPKPSRPRPRR